MYYKISDEYTNTPGVRYITDGEYSGEDFRENILKKLFLKALEKKDVLEIDLDDTYGYPSSFLEESFGGLARIYGKDKVKKIIKIISNDDPLQISRIDGYIENANDEKKQ